MQGDQKSSLISVRGPCLLFLASAVAVLAQKPTISPNGVVNAASFAGADQVGWAIVPGAVVSIIGQSLARTSRMADVPLPRELEGTSVIVDGLPAPLFYVSPTQINFQAPSALIGPESLYPRPVAIVVTTAAGVSEPVLIPVVTDATGIFTQGSQGCGQGLIENVASDGGRALNTPDHSASPGSFVSVYATGLGHAHFSPPDGQPTQADPLAKIVAPPVVRLGPEGFAQQAPNVTNAVRAPGFIGVDRIDVQIPDSAPEG